MGHECAGLWNRENRWLATFDRDDLNLCHGIFETIAPSDSISEKNTEESAEVVPSHAPNIEASQIVVEFGAFDRVKEPGAKGRLGTLQSVAHVLKVTDAFAVLLLGTQKFGERL